MVTIGNPMPIFAVTTGVSDALSFRVLALLEKRGYWMSDQVPTEKVITEINGFRQRLSMLKEELSRANRAMAEKMAMLGETLTQRVRDLRDQVTNTPQNLLLLETRFNSGEISDQEYKAQREDYRTQLTRNLRSIDEIRSLLMIISQLEARPSSSSSGQPGQGPRMGPNSGPGMTSGIN